MISGISGIGTTPGIITNITAASLGEVTAVPRVVKNPFADVKSANGNRLPVNDQVELGQAENPDYAPGTAYGMSANRLRGLGMAHQMRDEDAVESDQNPNDGRNPVNDRTSPEGQEEPAEAGEETKPNGEPLSDEEKQQLQELEARDQEVRVHEQAHLAAAGGYANGGAKYDYQQGPDGKKYAIGGSVQIDTSDASTPEATLAKMEQVRAAALAPAEPSSQDRSVAAEATQKMAQARQEMQAEKADKAGSESPAETREGEKMASPGARAEDTAAEESVSPYAAGVQAAASAVQAVSAQAAPSASGASSPSGMAKLSFQQLRARMAYHAA